MKRVYSSISDLGEVLNQIEIGQKGNQTINYGKKFALAVNFI